MGYQDRERTDGNSFIGYGFWKDMRLLLRESIDQLSRCFQLFPKARTETVSHVLYFGGEFHFWHWSALWGWTEHVKVRVRVKFAR